MALFKTNTELRLHVPARVSLDINDILPSMLQVEQDYLVAQVLGDEQYNELHVAYQAGGGAMTSRLTALLNACRPAVANLAVMEWASDGAVQITGTGIAAASAGNGEGIASQVKIDEFKAGKLRAGYSGLDSLLGFLNANVADYPLWAATEFASASKGLLRTTRQFNQVINIGNSHWLFWKLRPIVKRMSGSDSIIANTLCSADLYDLLVEESDAGDVWTGENAKLIAMIRPAIAHLAIADACVEMSLMHDPNRGVWTFNTLSGGQRGGGPVAATDQKLDAWQKYHTDRGNEYLGALEKRCTDLAAAGDLDLYEASDCYQKHIAGTDITPHDPTSKVGNFI